LKEKKCEKLIDDLCYGKKKLSRLILDKIELVKHIRFFLLRF